MKVIIFVDPVAGGTSVYYPNYDYKREDETEDEFERSLKNIIDNFEGHIDPKDPTNNCLDVAIITTPEKRTQKTKDKLRTVAGRVLSK